MRAGSYHGTIVVKPHIYSHNVTIFKHSPVPFLIQPRHDTDKGRIPETVGCPGLSHHRHADIEFAQPLLLFRVTAPQFDPFICITACSIFHHITKNIGYNKG